MVQPRGLQTLLLSHFDDLLRSDLPERSILFGRVAMFLDAVLGTEAHYLLAAVLELDGSGLVGESRIEMFEGSGASNGLNHVYFPLRQLQTLLLGSLETAVVEQLTRRGTHLLIDCQAHTDEPSQLGGISLRDVGVLAFGDLAVEGREVAGLEWHLQDTELVDEDSQGPDVAFVAVLLPRPYFRTGIVWSPCLS